MPHPLRGVRAVLWTLSMLALAACGANAPSTAPTGAASPASDGLTPPGTILHLGDAATVSDEGTDATVIELSVDGIDQGSLPELRRLRPSREGYDTYYVSYTMRLVSGPVQGFALFHHLTAWSGEDLDPGEPYLPDFPACQEQFFPTNAPPGTEISSCRIYLAPAGAAPVDTVRWATGKSYDYTAGTQVEWRR